MIIAERDVRGTVMRKKMLVLDIDGTLTNDNKDVTPATAAAIRRVLEEGHLVVLASGRPAPGTRRYERELALKDYNGYVLSFNGANIKECRTGRDVHQATLPQDVVKTSCRFAAEHNCGIITYQGDVVISAFEPDEYVMLESRVSCMDVRVVENFAEYVNFPVNKCLLTVDPTEAPAYVEELQDICGAAASIYRSEPFYIEIMPRNVDKASSLERLLKSVGMDREDMICCGDGYNDIPMVRYAGLGVAMGNAQPDLKAVADYVTGGNEEDGLVPVIEQFILNAQ